ncbi:thioesterase II family protein [Herbidospora cretacea]|uniref:thioesterase II family protein n=1 Tax=Herbidospora cretacea TaxID=28444 RepID=UPI0007739B74|nr:alpha/beta fold hydrolase [Herbidospora cretacea]
MNDDLWIRRFHPAPQAPARLVCLPHAGGSASFYMPVSSIMSPKVDVLAVQYPGRQDRRHEPLIPDLMTLADQVAEVLSRWMDRPTALFGHSMGAALAYEVALRLEAAGTAPAGVFVSGRRAPSTKRTENVHKRSDDGLVAELKRLAGTNAALLGDEEVLRMVLPATRNDYRAIETYEYDPGRRLTVPLVALTGDNDPKTTVDEARAWRGHTDGPFDLRVYPGGHFFLTPHAADVIDVINRFLTSQRKVRDDSLVGQ